jgi:hypothetical protein
MFLKRLDAEDTPKGHEDSVELQKMLTSCMINRQILVRATQDGEMLAHGSSF